MEINSQHSTHLALISFDDVFADLKKRGYTHQFRREPDCLCCIELYLWITPAQFNVDESYFFKDLSNPDGDRMLYAISTNNSIKGFLVDTCDVYTDNMSLEMRQSLLFSINKKTN